MDGWRVDTDRIVGVLAGVDDEGVELARAITHIEDLAFGGPDGLSADGRMTLANAWNAFLDERRLVPGKLAHVLASAAQSLTEATVAVVSGDARMADDARSAEAYALDEWGIDSASAYGEGSF